MIYGIRDAADLILWNKRTKRVEMFVNYANATSSEWTSESVYATAKGSNAIRWDGSRNGTLTLDTEVFDIGLIAMMVGSDIKSGRSDIMQREDAVLDSTRAIRLEGTFAIVPESVAVVRLNSIDDPSHAGEPLHNSSSAVLNLPKQVKDVSVVVTDTTARINFPRVAESDGYVVMRGGEEIADTQQNEYIVTGLTAATPYEFTVRATNQFGRGPVSAVVEATTSAEGVTEPVTFTATNAAKNTAISNTGEVVAPEAGVITYSLVDGVIQFSEDAVIGDAYAVYYMEGVDGVRTLEISADKFSDNYEIWATATMRERDTGADELIQIRYYNAKPQSNFTLTQSATDPTSLSIIFDLLPQGGKLADFHILP